jgi:uncharacterized protein
MSLIQGMRQCAWPTIAVALVLTVVSVYYTLTHLAIRTSRNDLVASSQRLITLSDKMEKDFGLRDGLVVVVEGASRSRSVEFADALAAELRQYPQEFADLFYRIDPERFKPWALLYLETPDLLKLKAHLLDNQGVMAGLAAEPTLSRFYGLVNEEITRALIGNLFTGFLEEEGKEKLPDLALLNASLRQLCRQLKGGQDYESPFATFFPKGMGELTSEGYFFTDNEKYLLFLITPQQDGFATKEEQLKVLRQVLAGVKSRFPDVSAGVTGPDALEADEMASALKDVTLATWLSILTQMVLLIIFLRSLRRTLVEGAVLVLGLIWTFGAATLVVGHLNLLSVVFAPLMLGLTIDYGIHWFCRQEEEEGGRGRCTMPIMTCTMRRSAPGIIYAGLAAMVSFMPLVFTGFKGLAELGLILTMGVFLMLVATLLLLPSLVIVSEKCTSAEEEEDLGDCGHPQPLLSLGRVRPGFIAALGLAVIALGGISLCYVPFDLNPLHLQNQKTESVAWEYKLLLDSQYSTSYGALASTSLADLEAKTKALKAMPTVSHVESILSFLPPEVEAKRKILQELTPLFAGIQFAATGTKPSDPKELAGVLGRIRFKLAEALASLGAEAGVTKAQLEEASRLLGEAIPLLDPQGNPQAASRLQLYEHRFFGDLNDKWDLMRANTTSRPPTIQDLPQAVRERFISPHETYLMRVFPSQDIWNFPPLHQFVKNLWSVDPNAVGDPVLLYTFTLGFRNACLWAAGIALAVITVMLLFLFRSLKMTLLAMLPLWVGTGLTLNLMWLLNLPFNQANVLFLPLILGEGIEFGIIILVRWQLEESARAITLPASTAKGVALAALTTTVGFGSLMISGHQGVFSLGLLATVGSLSVLVASLSVLPACLRLLEKKEPRRRPSFSPVLGLGWWSHHRILRKGPNEKTALDH